MKYILEVDFKTDDSDPNEGEVLEVIRSGVRDVIETFSLTINPIIKIWEVNQ